MPEPSARPGKCANSQLAQTSRAEYRPLLQFESKRVGTASIS